MLLSSPPTITPTSIDDNSASGRANSDTYGAGAVIIPFSTSAVDGLFTPFTEAPVAEAPPHFNAAMQLCFLSPPTDTMPDPWSPFVLVIQELTALMPSLIPFHLCLPPQLPYFLTNLRFISSSCISSPTTVSKPHHITLHSFHIYLGSFSRLCLQSLLVWSLSR